MAPTSPDDLAAPDLRTVLRQEQENIRLKAELGRQNEHVAHLEAENAELRYQVGELRAQVAALVKQNQHLLQEIGTLRAEVNRLRVAAAHESGEERMPGLGPPKPVLEKRLRMKRDRKHNRGRRRAATVA